MCVTKRHIIQSRFSVILTISGEAVFKSDAKPISSKNLIILADWLNKVDSSAAL